MTEKKQTYRQLKRKSGESYQVLGAMQNGKADTVAAKNNIMQLRLREAMRQDVMNEKNQLDALMEAIPVGIAILDEKGGRVKSNKEFEKIWGGSCPSVESIEDYSKYKAWWVDTGKPVKSEEWASAQAVLKGKTVIEQLLEIERFDGTRAFVINSAAPIFDSAGKITGSAVVIQDITEMRRAEEALRLVGEDFDRAQAVGNIGSWRLNVQTNELTWSDENHRIFGVPKGKPMTYEFFLSTIHPDDRQYVDEKWKAALAGEPYDIEHRIIVNGKVKWVREKAYLEFGSNGLLQGGFGTTQDITQRKLAEEEIANIAKFPEENPYPVLRITSEGTITYSNTPGCVLLKQWKCKVGEKVPKHWQEMIAKVMNSKACSVEEIQCSDLIFTLSITPVVDLGYVNIYGQDITKRKKAEEELYHTNQMLEQRVQERTAELAETVSVLQEEVRQRITAENAARSERQKFNDVLETLPAYVCLLTPDYRMPFANRVFREWFGYESDKKCYEFLFNRTEPCEICETFKVFEDNKPHRWEWTGPNGRNYDIFDFPFEDTDGSQLILEMGIDVTERKRNEQLLERQAEELWEKAELLDLAHDSIVVHDLDGKITFWSRGAESIYGYSRQEALGNNS
ncbi:MAG: PAS domain S-box protein, partial [Phycisphaerae bacterium]